MPALWGVPNINGHYYYYTLGAYISLYVYTMCINKSSVHVRSTCLTFNRARSKRLTLGAWLLQPRSCSSK